MDNDKIILWFNIVNGIVRDLGIRKHDKEHNIFIWNTDQYSQFEIFADGHPISAQTDFNDGLARFYSFMADGKTIMQGMFKAECADIVPRLFSDDPLMEVSLIKC